ncbi:hypothetical protein B0A52_02520 [Exophiala mesophila]|uniref:Acetoacetate-CoA ligase n=1 Tax=Exophiala mesophila TaxID=212818 RepID=A0A438ND33_EXOME|nr:hypothetical protein B0A52_02520 [Exophiala mesophila]
MRWQHPSPHLTRLDAFRRQVNQKYKTQLQTYDDLHKWSVDELEAFCRELWAFCGVVYTKPPTKVAIAHPDAIAVSACREGGTQWQHLSWRELRARIELWVSSLKAAGIGKGDRIATVTTNSIDSVLVLLAAGCIGAIFSSTSPDLGTQGIVERYMQIQPKIIFCDSEVLYNGKILDLRSKLSAALKTLRERSDTVEKVVVLSGRTWNDSTVISSAQFLDVNPVPLQFEQVGFDHPIYILFSSGTTGAPKCICHAGGAALLQQKKEFILNSDMNLDSVYYQYTTTGWMMWNYLILEEQGVTHWGTSPNFLATLKQKFTNGTRPTLETLHLIRWLFNGSGGTDLVSGIVDCNVLQPFELGQISRPQLGMKVEIWNSLGQRIEDFGVEGDLVITKPFFSMPITFWGDGGTEKYRLAYFDRFEGFWWHGDFIRREQNGSYEILGRSDGVLNPRGVRFGTAELYSVLDKFPQIADYIAVGQRRPEDRDEQVLLFLKMKSGRLDKELIMSIKSSIRKSLSARHVPALIEQVDDIPYTLNGKRVENVVKDIVSGRNPRSHNGAELGHLEDGETILRVLYLSIDPAMRGWLDNDRSYLAPVEVGDVMRGQGMAVVEESRSETFTRGSFVLANTGWREVAKLHESTLQAVRVSHNIQLTDWLGVLGYTGMSAYFGLTDIGKVGAGDLVVITGAAGATGCIAGQIAKLKGATVIGIAGSDEKCSWLVSELGFDIALNYKASNFKHEFTSATENLIDVFYDNVGGEILDFALTRAKQHARFVMCGAVSQHNTLEPYGLKNYLKIVRLRIRMEGFIVLDYENRFAEARLRLSEWLKDGKIKSQQTIVKGGLLGAEQALLGLYEGRKLLVEVSKYEGQSDLP